MTPPVRPNRLATIGATAGLAVAVAAGMPACSSPGRIAGHPAGQPGHTAGHPVRTRLPGPGTLARPVLGTLGNYWVGQRLITFVEPTHTGPTGIRLGPRALLTSIRYPLAGRPAPGTPRAKGHFPLIVFGPGFMQCGGPYSRLLQAWATAGYVVAVVNFPHSDCQAGSGATEADLVNQPHDMSYVITRLVALSAAPHGLFAGMLNTREIAVTGQSDGGDTVAAIAANTCCADHRVIAVAVLSGQEWARGSCPSCQLTGRYFSRLPVPILFTQGSADVVNIPATSELMYRADRSRQRYYLDLLGASHTGPYWGSNPAERIVVRVTLAFFDRFVLGQARAGLAMKRAGNVRGLAVLVSGGRLPP